MPELSQADIDRVHQLADDVKHAITPSKLITSTTEHTLARAEAAARSLRAYVRWLRQHHAR